MNTISFDVVSTDSKKDFLVNAKYKDKQFKQ